MSKIQYYSGLRIYSCEKTIDGWDHGIRVIGAYMPSNSTTKTPFSVFIPFNHQNMYGHNDGLDSLNEKQVYERILGKAIKEYNKSLKDKARDKKINNNIKFIEGLIE